MGKPQLPLVACFFSQLHNALNNLSAFRLINLFPLRPNPSVHKFANSKSNLVNVRRKTEINHDVSLTALE